MIKLEGGQDDGDQSEAQTGLEEGVVDMFQSCYNKGVWHCLLVSHVCVLLCQGRMSLCGKCFCVGKRIMYAKFGYIFTPENICEKKVVE